MPLGRGFRLGPYEILSALGAGGMGEVYRARDTRLDRTVALKVLPQELAADPDRRSRFEREARAIAALSHPHICVIHDVGRDADVNYLVMEYLDGETLADRVARSTGHSLPIAEVVQYAVEIADALDKAHRAGIVHRDLKPANIMLTKSGVKLLDFGLAAEQVEGREADARSDIWALGVVIFEMATGTRPFEGASAASVTGSVLKDTPPPVSSRQPLAPAALDHAVSRCLARDPDDCLPRRLRGRAFQSDREGDQGIWWQRADGTGTATRLTKAEPGASHVPESWHPKSDLFLYSIAKETVTLWSYSMKDGKSAPVGNVRSSYPINAVFSPDGRWFAYTSDDSAATPALHVTAFPPAGTPYRISQRQGLQPIWSRDGKEIFFNPAPGQYLKVGISTSPIVTFTNPVPIPRPFVTGGPPVIRNNDMTPDGKILGIPVGNTDAGSSGSFQLQVVLNWFEELKARVPVK